MSRRSGQDGSVCIKGTKYIGRYRVDVPGQNKRARRTVIIGNTSQFTKPQAERWLAKFIEEQGINDASHLARSQSPVLTFGLSARGWREHHLIVNKKRSSQSSMSCELNKHILPHLKDTPLEEITYPVVRGLIQMWQEEDLSRKSIKNLFGIVRAVYNFHFDEMAQSGKPIVSPWLVKWKKVAPPKAVQRELPHFTVAQMAAIVNAAKTQMYRSLFALAAGSGARAGELFALRVESDVDLDEQMHAFRRGRISQLVYSGVSRQVIRDWCGHSSDKMIDHYTKLLRQHHAPEMAKLKPLLDPSWTQVNREESGTQPQVVVN